MWQKYTHYLTTLASIEERHENKKQAVVQNYHQTMQYKSFELDHATEKYRAFENQLDDIRNNLDSIGKFFPNHTIIQQTDNFDQRATLTDVKSDIDRLHSWSAQAITQAQALASVYHHHHHQNPPKDRDLTKLQNTQSANSSPKKHILLAVVIFSILAILLIFTF